MSYPRFAAYNVLGGLFWVLSFLLAGWGFAGLEIVKKRFHYVIFAVILVSILPAVVEVLRARVQSRRAGAPVEV
jgi:membrane-associated protein